MNKLEIEKLQYYNLEPVSLEIQQEIIGLGGASGTGKTLFLRAIADLDPHKGRIFLNGRHQSDFPPPQWRKNIGFLPSESQWWFDRVGDHFQAVSQSWLNRLGFDSTVFTWQVSRLSSGEKQRLAFLRLLSIKPTCLLLDEPTANIDSERTDSVIDLVKDFQKQHAAPVIWVSHTVDRLKSISDRLYLIKHRKMVPVENP